MRQYRVINVTRSIFLFLKILFIFRERKEGVKRGRETSMCGCLSRAPYQLGLACNPGMCPDWESNR